ncbi:MAG: HNH endonuclease, partial [Pseudomonadota bacterium]
KIAFANDPANLILTERSELRKKGDRGPSRYLPREEYQCDYARQWLAIAEKYELRMANQDRNRITVLLRECGVD